MKDVLSQLSQYPVRTRVSLTGSLIVVRDIAPARLIDQLQGGIGLPDYFKQHPIYYAGSAKTPQVYKRKNSVSYCLPTSMIQNFGGRNFDNLTSIC